MNKDILKDMGKDALSYKEKEDNHNNIQFFNEGTELVGTLDFKGPKITFKGEAEESAQIFFNIICDNFPQLIENFVIDKLRG